MVTNKTNSVRGFLQRNLAKCTKHVKSLSNTTFVHPILDYACTVWSPYYQSNIYSIEMAQRRAARFVLNKFSNYDSVSPMIVSLGWTTLEDRCNKHRAVMLYKIIHGIVEVQSHTYLTPTPSPHHTRGHHHRFQQLPTRVDSYKYSFFPDTLKIWNSLPEHIVELSSNLATVQRGFTLITLIIITFNYYIATIAYTCTTLLIYEVCTLMEIINNNNNNNSLATHLAIQSYVATSQFTN